MAPAVKRVKKQLSALVKYFKKLPDVDNAPLYDTAQ